MDTTKIPHGERPPDLLATDIPWGRHGLSVGFVYDLADTAIYREMTETLVAAVAAGKQQVRQKDATIAALRDESRAERETTNRVRAENADLRTKLDALHSRVRALEAELRGCDSDRAA